MCRKVGSDQTLGQFQRAIPQYTLTDTGFPIRGVDLQAGLARTLHRAGQVGAHLLAAAVVDGALVDVCGHTHTHTTKKKWYTHNK